jgi:hypothetical protein
MDARVWNWGENGSGTKERKRFNSCKKHSKGQHRKDRHDQDAANTLGRAQVIGASPQSEERTPDGKITRRQGRPDGAVGNDVAPIRTPRSRRKQRNRGGRLADRKVTLRSSVLLLGAI